MKQDYKKIVWLASYPKSGNTWFRIFLANLLHEGPDVIDINQLNFIPVASSRLLFDEHAGGASADLSLEEIEELRPKIYRKLAFENNDLIYLKVHDAWKQTSSGKPMFPPDITKTVIYFIRNPLDVSVSFAFHSGKSLSSMVEELNDPKKALGNKKDRIQNQLEQELSDWSGHVTSWVDNSGLPIFVMRYEDMLEDTFKIFKNALFAIGLKKSNSEIKLAIEACNFINLVENEQKFGFREKPINMKTFFRKGLAGDWREHLDKKDVNILIKKHGQLMKRFGYLEENRPII